MQDLKQIDLSLESDIPFKTEDPSLNSQEATNEQDIESLDDDSNIEKDLSAIDLDLDNFNIDEDIADIQDGNTPNSFDEDFKDTNNTAVDNSILPNLEDMFENPNTNTENTQDIIPTEDFSLSDETGNTTPDEPSLDDFSLSDETDNTTPDEPSLDDFSLSDETDNTTPDEPSLDDFSLSDETDNTTPDEPSLDDFSLSDETDNTTPDEPSLDDFSLSDETDNTTPDEPSLDDFSLSDENNNIDFSLPIESLDNEFDLDMPEFSLENNMFGNNTLKLDDLEEMDHQSFITSSEQQETAETQNKPSTEVDSADTASLKQELIDARIAALPTDLKNHLQNFLDAYEPDNPVVLKINKELRKKQPNIHTLEKLTDFHSHHTKPKKNLLALSIILGVLLIVTGAYLGIEFITNQKNHILQKGISLIEHGKVEEGDQIFIKNSPNTDWYNKYIETLIDQGAFNMAGIYLLGDKTERQGLLQLEPKNKRGLMNLSRLFTEQGQYEQALANNTTLDGIPAVSLAKLKTLYPDDVVVFDLIGKAHIGIAETTHDKALKEEHIKKAYDLYLDLNTKYLDNPTILSRLLEVSLLSKSPKIRDQLQLLSERQILGKIDTDTLAKMGTHYLNEGSISKATLFFNTLKIRSEQNPKKKFTALAYSFFGQFYIVSGDMKSAENNLILAVYQNSRKDAQDNIISIKNPSLQGVLSNSLGRVYMKLLQEYNNKNDFNKKQRDEYKNLSLYHLKESQKYNPQDPLNPYLLAEIEYTTEKNYKNSIKHYEEAIKLMDEADQKPPIDLLYNYGNALYNNHDYENAITVLSDLRSERPLYYPALEYLLGISYYHTGVYSQAVDKMNRALEFYNPELQRLQQKGYSTNVSEDKLLYFGSVINNNLGVIFQIEGNRLNNEAMKSQARTYFYTALEYSKRMNQETVLSFPDINFKESLLTENINIQNTPNIQGRTPLIYEYTPTSLQEYK